MTLSFVAAVSEDLRHIYSFVCRGHRLVILGLCCIPFLLGGELANISRLYYNSSRITIFSGHLDYLGETRDSNITRYLNVTGAFGGKLANTSRLRYNSSGITIYSGHLDYREETRDSNITRYLNVTPMPKTKFASQLRNIDVSRRYKNNVTYVKKKFKVDITNMKLCDFLVFDDVGEIQYPRGKQRGNKAAYVRKTYGAYVAGLKVSSNDRVQVLWGGTALHAIVGGDWSHDNDVDMNPYQRKKYSCVCFYGNKPALCGNKKGATRSSNGKYPDNQQPPLLEYTMSQFGTFYWMELKKL